MRPLHSRKQRATISDSHRYLSQGIWTSMSEEDYLSEKDRAQIVDEAGEHLCGVVKKYFPRTANLEYAILKTHLIVEGVLTQFIRCSSFLLVDPETIRLSFLNKLEVAVLLGFGHGCPTAVPSTEILNRIRNQVAHRFSFDRQLVDELIKINNDDVDVTNLSDRQRITRLRIFCAKMCGQVAGWLKVMVHVTARETTPLPSHD